MIDIASRTIVVAGAVFLAAQAAISNHAHAAQPTRPAGDTAQWVTPAVRADGVQRRVFHSRAAGRDVSYHVFVPSAYDDAPDRRFPVLYWLHGGGGGLAGIPRLAREFDEAMTAGRMPPMLVVFPNGLELSLWVDSKDGSVPVETVVVHELIPHIDSTLRTIASRDGRILEGFSMGGYGAARFAFKHHDLFGAVSILAGGPLQPEFTATPRAGPRQRAQVLHAVFGDDMDYYRALSPWVLAELNAAALTQRTRIRLVIGEADEMLEVNRRFHEHLTGLGIPHQYVVVPGAGHQPLAVWQGLGENRWAFYRAGGPPPD